MKKRIKNIGLRINLFQPVKKKLSKSKKNKKISGKKLFINKNDKSQKKKKYDIEGSKSIMESEINITVFCRKLKNNRAHLNVEN